MRATKLLLTAALTLSSTAAFAQSSYNVVVEPVQPTIDTIISAPIEYDENGVMKAQYFNADSLTEEQYQALLDEADRIHAYREANGLNFEDEYVYSDAAPAYTDATVVHSAATTTPYTGSTYTGETYSPATTYAPATTYTGSTYTGETYTTTFSTNVAAATPSYQIDLFAPETSAPTSSYTTSSSKTHTVSKGDTLYNISKRYDTSVQSIQAENGLSGTSLSIGQRLSIPGVVVETINTVSQPIFASAPTRDGFVTRRVVEPAPTAPTIQFENVAASEAIYAVLPKDTLYSISRRTCVGVKDIISRNDISNPNALQPGQRITLPVGHCLSR